MLVAQGLEDCEVIVVNDGSTDDTEKICNIFAADHQNITLLSLAVNSGVSVARNTGLKEARGKYICFFDSDDTFMPNTLSYFKETIKKLGDLDVFAFGSIIRKNNRTLKKLIGCKYSGMIFDGRDWLLLILEKRIKHLMIGSTLILRELLQLNKITFAEGIAFGEDLDFFIRAFFHLKSLYYDARICYIYDIRDNSTTRGYKHYSIQQFSAYIIISKYIERLIGERNDISRQGHFYLANLYTANLYFYLKSDKRDNAINQLFLENKKILYKDYSGQTLRLLLFYFLRIIPIKLLLFVFRKNHS
jgi:glycosyltransferase involved in cell wall biosynthesis